RGLFRGEVADHAADDGAEQRPDERHGDRDHGTDPGPDRGALGDWILEHDRFLSTMCIILTIHMVVQPRLFKRPPDPVPSIPAALPSRRAGRGCRISAASRAAPRARATAG